MKPKIGFMGLGIMGAPMAANILKAGYPLTVYNRTAAKAEPLAKLGAQVAASPKALAQDAQIIVAMVTGPEALYELLFGPEGAAEAFGPEQVFINMSSVSPSFTLELGKELAPTAIRFVDAPVSGTKKPAEDGALVILAGGNRQRVQELEPLFLTMGKKVIYCGKTGQGSMMKMFINLLLGLMMEGFAEALNFGRLGGLDLEAMLETVASGAMNAPMFQVKAANFRDQKFQAAFPLKHLAKDAKFVVDTAYELGAPVPAGQMLLHLYRLGVAQGWGDEDISAIAKVMEFLSPPK
ncbi:MAG: NAD(P)-dependent oxidoreductase [Syntrophobacterales bacterium]|jgi:3-hydroxyisobutyrate dehydrogenase-like beta-hydroxyacid dehydrogenase|nr:NAD(P)-dependent oxidoreductase [Syntrophobacterales bacterium]